MRLHNFSKQSKVALTLRQAEKKGVITIERKRIQSAGLPDS